MDHPHQHFLDEFKIAIDKLVPLIPEEIRTEALTLHKELTDNPEVTEHQIHQALVLVGRKEYPYRHAYKELCESDEELRLQTAVFERLDESLKKKIEEITKNGVMLDDFVASKLFEEQLSPEERYQVEQAILAADDILEHQCSERAAKKKIQYEELVKKHQEEVDRMQKMIDELRSMGDRDLHWKEEINSIADKLEEGWSMVERDPTEEEIKKEIESWSAIFAEGAKQEGV
ncbi:MAG: hypothetical protein WC730_02135 [Patescibacteria group bacterium]|jgi:hypothetical protein